MPQTIEDALTSKLAAYIDSNRPEGFPPPSSLPVHVAARDEIRTRPCLALEATECKPVPGAKKPRRATSRAS